MKHYLLGILLAATITSGQAQTHRLEKLWETDTVIAVPESVLPDTKKGLLYVSLIDGAPWGVDGQGGVEILDVNGKIINSKWITGLNAPKGLGRVGNKLYVADISEVVVIDIKKGTIEKKIAVDSATGLNDITVSDKGEVYVSDSKTARIWKIVNDKPSLYLENMKGANGLKAIKDDLYILSGKSFVKADAHKQITTIVELPQAGDGLEPIGNGDFIATSWSGYIYYVYANGTFETLLDTHLDKVNTADIGYDAAKRLLYVPTFNAKKIMTFLVK
ncbi:ATP-binding protein [Parasediminibacterium paludis]|uniref:ATP-binding protein n=1 Tax=Parasediminibacterium paludis TaxID=908966 RepID=A0ABV8PZV4_9BACT